MRKYFFYTLLVAVNFSLFANAGAQAYCYTCDYDSLQQVKEKATTAEEKIRILTLMFQQRINTESADEILALSSLVKGFDPKPYRKIREALALEEKRDFANELIPLHEAVELFDKKQAVIIELLSKFRHVYSVLNKQEERLNFYQQKLAYYQVNGPVENTAACFWGLAGYYYGKNDLNAAISYYLKAADVYKSFDPRRYIGLLVTVSSMYGRWGNNEKAKTYLQLALPWYLQSNNPVYRTFGYLSLARLHLQTKDYQAAEAAALQVLQNTATPRNRCLANVLLASMHLAQKAPRKALPYLLKGQKLKDSLNLPFSLELEFDYYYFECYNQLGKSKEAEKYLLSAYREAMAAQYNEVKLKYLQALSLFYAKHNKSAEAFHYGSEYYNLKDSLEKQLGASRVAHYENEQKEREQNNRITLLKQEAAVKEATIQQRNLILLISAGAILLIVASVVFLYQQLKINKKTLQTLRKTQRQLIQAEKMASLGELTAGIAHEIQNPLNFINNFSEVSVELMEELKYEAAEGNQKEIHVIAAQVSANLQKVVSHSKRVDAIVKGMLQHVQTGSGDKQPTNLNALVEEFLRLSYNGIRAREKKFKAVIETHLDQSIGKIAVVPQDIGRVLLNLFNNAFYAVREKKKKFDGVYEPTVSVSTQLTDQTIVIQVKDNGTGISERVMEKIYQPFFTTKPTGEGTGLGLSLSYDIITKGHGGELTVESEVGKGTTFRILLPVQKPALK